MAEKGTKPQQGTPIMGLDADGTAQFMSVVAGEATATALGTPADAAWNGTDPEASVISLLKAIAINTKPA